MGNQLESDLMEKRSRLRLFVVLVFLIVLIIGLSLGIVFLKKNEESNKEEEAYSDLNSKVAQFEFGPGLDEGAGSTYEEISSEIREAMNEAKDQRYVVLNCVLLSRVQYAEEMVEESVRTIEECEEIEGLEDENKYNLLSQMFSIMAAENDLDGQIVTASMILELPEDMELEYIDWISVRENFQKVLESLSNRRNEPEGYEEY